MQAAIVIAGFPGVGKSELFKKGIDGFKIYDSDSSKYSWIWDENGNKTDQRNPDFPDNYIQHIKEHLDDEKAIILVSTHKEVREALVKAKIHFTIIVPTSASREDYLENYKNRGNDQSFIDMMDKNFTSFIFEIMDFCNASIYPENAKYAEFNMLKPNAYLKDYVEYQLNLVKKIGVFENGAASACEAYGMDTD